MGQKAVAGPRRLLRRARVPLRALGLAIALCFLSFCEVGAHDHLEEPVAVVVNPLPQEALETLLEERQRGPEEGASVSAWVTKRLRGNNSLSEIFRDSYYDSDIKRLNPTCAVIGFLLRTVPVCPVVRQLEKCECTEKLGDEQGDIVDEEGTKTNLNCSFVSVADMHAAAVL